MEPKILAEKSETVGRGGVEAVKVPARSPGLIRFKDHVQRT